MEEQGRAVGPLAAAERDEAMEKKGVRGVSILNSRKGESLTLQSPYQMD